MLGEKSSLYWTSIARKGDHVPYRMCLKNNNTDLVQCLQKCLTVVPEKSARARFRKDRKGPFATFAAHTGLLEAKPFAGNNRLSEPNHS